MILAAGEGRRIGGNKALRQINGKSFLEAVIVPMLNIALDPLIVVIGTNAPLKTILINLNVNFEINDNWQSGQFSSLKAGMTALPKNIPGVMISLVDHPKVKSETYKLLCHIFMENSKKIILPIYNGRRGHPIIIPRVLIDEILKAPDDSNLKEIIWQHTGLVLEQLVDDPGILQDIDTEEDLKKIGKS